MRFPHLTDATAFPGDDTRVYGQYVNTTDYDLWTPDTRIRLCRVAWYDDYHDVVKFRDDAERDAFFDGLDGEDVRLDTAMYIARADSDGVKLPVPYMTCQKYNYVVVDYGPRMSSSPYQDPAAQSRYHYFVTGMTAEAPNTTTCTLVRDVWTDYINATTINGLLLTRGHAPLAAMPPERLLENPRLNCAGLTLPDVDYGGQAARVPRSTPVSLEGGARYVCLACTCTPAQLSDMSAHRGTDIADGAPVYTGDDATVTGFAWGAGGVDTSGAAGRGAAYHSVDGTTAGNVTIYAIPAADMPDGYMDVIFERHPDIAAQIVACFVATDDMMTTGDAVPVEGVAWRVASGRDARLADIRLTPGDYGYPTAYARISRLYLAPYAHLEVSDNIGGTMRVEIADCGQLSVRMVTSLSYPVLRRMAWLDGVRADGTTTVTVSALDGGDLAGRIPDGDATRTMLAHDIPTYALQRRAVDAHRAETYNSTVVQGRQTAILSYENAARSANTARGNTNRGAATALGNTQRTNAASTANTARGNQRDTDLTTELISVRNDNLTYAQTRQNADLQTANTKITTDVYQDNTLQNKAYIENSQTQAMTAVSSAIGSLGAVGLTIATGGAAAPVAMGAMTLSNAALQGYNTSVAITNNLELNQTSNDVSITKANAAKTANTEQTAHALTQQTDTNSRANRQSTTNLTITTTAATDITATNVNASNANAQSSYDTTTANAADTRATTIGNAQRTMDNARSNVNAAWRDLLNTPARAVGSYGGDNILEATRMDTMTVKVVTEDAGAIAAAGEYMLRYGIAANRMYSAPDLTPCRHYCYWRCADAWLTCPGAQTEHIRTIRDILTAGVTIWSDPTEVGGDYMHDNL